MYPINYTYILLYILYVQKLEFNSELQLTQTYTPPRNNYLHYQESYPDLQLLLLDILL